MYAAGRYEDVVPLLESISKNDSSHVLSLFVLGQTFGKLGAGKKVSGS